MAGHCDFTLRTGLVLLAVLGCASAGKVQFKLGGDVTLSLEPPVSKHIENILWKFQGNLLAEWVENKVDLIYYGSFDGRATLDLTTARLQIRNMNESDVGLYTVEINGVAQDQSFQTEVVKEVPVPEVVDQPLTCSSSSEDCKLLCDGNTAGAEPVTYSWKKGDGPWMEMKRVLEIIKAETEDAKTFTCRIKNAVSEKESKAHPNPFLKVPPGPDLKTILGTFFGLLFGIGVLCGLGYWQRENIKGICNGHAPAPQPHPVPKPAPAPAPAPAPEPAPEPQPAPVENHNPETIGLINSGENNSGNGPSP